MELLALDKEAARRPTYAGAMSKPRPKLDDSVARNLKRLMKLRDWSQSELARQSGVSQTHIGSIVRGETSCSPEVANLLAAPFGLEGWHLLIPRLPDELVSSPSLAKLVQAYISASDDGREFLDAAAEREIRRKKP